MLNNNTDIDCETTSCLACPKKDKCKTYKDSLKPDKKKITGDHPLCQQCKFDCKQFPNALLVSCEYITKNANARKLLAQINKQNKKKRLRQWL